MSISSLHIYQVLEKIYTEKYGSNDTNHIVIDRLIKRLINEHTSIGKIEYVFSFQTSQYDLLKKILGNCGEKIY